MLKKIGSAARYEIERQLDAKVNLRIWVKVKKDWRDSDFLMKNFGYREEEQNEWYLGESNHKEKHLHENKLMMR